MIPALDVITAPSHSFSFNSIIYFSFMMTSLRSFAFFNCLSNSSILLSILTSIFACSRLTYRNLSFIIFSSRTTELNWVVSPSHLVFERSSFSKHMSDMERRSIIKQHRALKVPGVPDDNIDLLAAEDVVCCYS
jgi:hypothetical protein